MDFVFYLAQGISILTAIVAIIIMQFKSMKLILLGQIAVNVLTATTYLMLGGFSGAGICFIAIIQTVVMYAYNSKNVRPHVPVIIVFLISYVACSAYYFKSFIDIFSAIAAILFAISVTQKKPSASRLWYLANPLCWVIYDIYTKAYGNLIVHLIIFISTASAIIRLDIPFKKKNNT